MTCQLYDECHLAHFMTEGPLTQDARTHTKSQLIDKAAEEYMEVIDSVSPLI